jgi:hypothetical protein
LWIWGVDVGELVDVDVGDVDVVADGDFGFVGIVDVMAITCMAIGLGADEGG